MSTDPFAAEANQFLSGGLTAAKFPTVGFVVEGTVTAFTLRQQSDYDSGEPKFWKDGRPAMQLVVDLQSEATGKTWEGLRNVEKALPLDDGMRALYVRGNLQKALTAALRTARSPFETGGHIRIERVADAPKVDRAKEPAHQYKVTWTPASKNASAAADFLSPASDEDNPFS